MIMITEAIPATTLRMRRTAFIILSNVLLLAQPLIPAHAWFFASDELKASAETRIGETERGESANGESSEAMTANITNIFFIQTFSYILDNTNDTSAWAS